MVRSVNAQYDVIVLGGGTAGVIAAVQAGRAGVRTLLVEKSGMLGGTMTQGGVAFPGLFHARGRQVIAGIGWELVARCVEEAGGRMPDFSDSGQRHWQLQVRLNPHLYAALCDEAVTGAGVDLLFHAMPAAIRALSGETGPDWEVTLCTKTGLSTHAAKVVIDATGDANGAAIAGFALNIPAEIQPATLLCSASGYDPKQVDMEALNAAFDAEVKAGRMEYTDVSWNADGPNVGQWLHHYGKNANHLNGINARDSEGKSRLEVAARRQLLRLHRFLRRQPGLEGIVIDGMSPECGVRETATIRGKATVTVDDYRSGRIWEDALCFSYYPIDLHESTGAGLTFEMLSHGVVPTIPRGALLPERSRNFIIAGRAISSDRLANSALRVQATCMATGQAAGALAALAARTGTEAGALPIADVASLLREHGAVVP